MCSTILGETTCSCFDCYVATGDFDFDMTVDENPYTDELVISEMIQEKNGSSAEKCLTRKDFISSFNCKF